MRREVEEIGLYISMLVSMKPRFHLSIYVSVSFRSRIFFLFFFQLFLSFAVAHTFENEKHVPCIEVRLVFWPWLVFYIS